MSCSFLGKKLKTNPVQQRYLIVEGAREIELIIDRDHKSQWFGLSWHHPLDSQAQPYSLSIKR